MASPQALTPVPVSSRGRRTRAAAAGGANKKKGKAAAAAEEEEEEQQPLEVKMPGNVKAWKVKVTQSPLDSEQEAGGSKENMMEA